MFDFIYIEILKVKKSKVILCLILTAVILPAIWFFLSLFFYPHSSWISSSIEVEDFMFLILETLIFILLSNYVFVKEYSYGTKEIEYAYPVNRINIYVSKVLVTYVILIVIYIVHFFIVFLGLTVTMAMFHIKNILFTHFKAYMLSILFQFCVVPIMVIIGNALKRYSYSILISIFIYFFSIVLFSLNKYRNWPFIFQYIPVLNVNNIGSKANSIYILMTFLGTFILGAVQYWKMNENKII
ncbi:ABC transporter permease [Clostridium felsineum]|uniref:Uncharacterized protein n=1 Tax=Clostridium felsineum TaxID=36839 RepID=A0A1S8LDZ0_9CLOT|nr:ABC transporter permease [Clostridium felsineum]MCR3760972.1 ABC transporter permease [Clostridium felsineum]URZ01906.1 hypothetical protein CLAUR_019030 [Clostridium felsineum]URZ05256.1 hypothetical protein CLROS_005800 [Clostridium felsineum]URZ10297.1 hypothetical protein CROST_010050 [Clostridium felsineum]